MLFSDLSSAFEEMEWLTLTTGRTHLVLHSGTRSKTYRVIARNGWIDPQIIIAELNCRNVVGESLIKKDKGKRHYVGGEKKQN